MEAVLVAEDVGVLVIAVTVPKRVGAREEMSVSQRRRSGRRKNTLI
jgi:hypothetical protein